MNPHPVYPSEDDLSLDSDERTLVVQSHHWRDAGLSAQLDASAAHAGANDASPLDVDKLFNADNDTGDNAGSDVLRFDRRSGGVVTGEGADSRATTPSGQPIARTRSRRRGWILATFACVSALTLATLSAVYADTIASRLSAELRPWLVAHGKGQSSAR